MDSESDPTPSIENTAPRITPMLSEDDPTTKGVRRAILVAVQKVEGFSYLPQAHIDIERMKTFLICTHIVTKSKIY